MKILLISLVTLLIAVVAALIAMEDPGYMLIAVGGWTVETTVALSAVIIVLVFVTLYYSIRATRRVLSVPESVRQWRKQRHEQQAIKSLTRGLIDLAEGHWAAAEKKVLKYLPANDDRYPAKGSTTRDSISGEATLLNYLAAARAAQAQGADQRRDHYLRLAHENNPAADIAVGLTQAELQLKQNQLEQALATLRHLQQLAPKQPQVLQALAELYKRLGDWEHVLEIAPLLRRYKVMPADAITELSEQAYLMLLQAAKTFPELTEVWGRILEPYRESETILANYVARLLKMGESNLAEPLLRHALHRQISEPLLRLYGKIEGAEPARQLALVEALLTNHARNAVVLLTAGRLSLRNKLWGKARSYLEASVNAQPNAEAYNELGNLLERMGESMGAAECFRAGLSLVPGCEQSTPISMELAVNPVIALSNEAISESETAMKKAVAGLRTPTSSESRAATETTSTKNEE